MITDLIVVVQAEVTVLLSYAVIILQQNVVCHIAKSARKAERDQIKIFLSHWSVDY